LEIPRDAILVRRVAERDYTGLAWAKMLNDTLDYAVLSARIAAFKNYKHLMAMLDYVFLNLNKFYLEGPQRGFIFGAFLIAMLLSVLRHRDAL
jgi:hypothetical protein